MYYSIIEFSRVDEIMQECPRCDDVMWYLRGNSIRLILIVSVVYSRSPR